MELLGSVVMDRVSFTTGLIACWSLHTRELEFVEVPANTEVVISTMELLP
jgi:hypothetical protein